MRTWHGIAAYGTSRRSIHNLVIDRNEVDHLELGWSESVVVNGNVRHWRVTNNRVHDNDNIGIDAIGYEGECAGCGEADRARDGVIAGNVVARIDSKKNPAYNGARAADGVYVDGGTRILIERNVVHHANLGIEIASEHKGKSTSYTTVRNNFLYRNTQVGIAMGGYDTKRGSTEHCFIVGNTLLADVTTGDWGAELTLQYDTRSNTIKNNIIYAGAGKRFIDSWSPVMRGNVVDHNLYYAPGGGSRGTWAWRGVSHPSFAAYRNATGNDRHSTAAVDPRLISARHGDLHLQSTSPARDAGEATSFAGRYDIDHQQRVQGRAVDLGADEIGADRTINAAR